MSKVTAADETTVPLHGLPSPEKRWNIQCLNCGYELRGDFCSHCGQRAVPPHPTVRELAGDAFSEFSGWDGKFADTIRTLVRKPGEMTRQWLEGRRVRFIAPLRLYLTASLVYFVLQAAAPSSPLRVAYTPGPAVSAGKSQPSRPDVVAAAISKALSARKPLTQAELDAVAPSLAKAPPLMQPIMRHLMTDPAGVFATMRQFAPRVLFALLPFYAGILALFYRKRHYPEHLYFAIHLHAFVFLALAVPRLVSLAHAGVVGSIVGPAILLWIATYSVLALRRVYGGSIGKNLLKGIGIMMLYMILALPALLITVTLAALT